MKNSCIFYIDTNFNILFTLYLFAIGILVIIRKPMSHAVKKVTHLTFKEEARSSCPLKRVYI